MGWGILIVWGIIAIIVGFVLISMDVIRERGVQPTRALEEEKPTVKGGGVIMIGPVPIAFGSDTRYLVIALVLTIVLMLLALVFIFIYH
ncbi:MAG: TIGR00304 family protein [Methanocellales archaeon]|nr:TIGR00304 family protein [Methanocellales archaeon]